MPQTQSSHDLFPEFLKATTSNSISGRCEIPAARASLVPAGSRLTTAPYYICHLTIYSHDIPKTVRGIPGFPRRERDIWVWKRETRNLLLAIEPRNSSADARGAGDDRADEGREGTRAGKWCETEREFWANARECLAIS